MFPKKQANKNKLIFFPFSNTEMFQDIVIKPYPNLHDLQERKWGDEKDRKLGWKSCKSQNVWISTFTMQFFLFR